MPLDFHRTVDAPTKHATDSASVAQTKLNSNFTLCKTNEQTIENRLEDAFYDTHSSGVLWGMEVTVPGGGGLSVDVAAGRALVGVSLAYAGGSVSVAASQSPGYIFFCQDGTFHVDDDNSAPTDRAAFLLATYTSDGSDTLTVTLEAQGSHYDKIEAHVAGTVSTGIIKVGVFDRDCWIDDVQITLSDSGLYDTTTVDFHAGDAGATPPTVFTTQGNRPSIASLSDVFTVATSGAPEANRLCTVGQVYFIEVDAVGTTAVDLGVLVRLRYVEDLS